MAKAPFKAPYTFNGEEPSAYIQKIAAAFEAWVNEGDVAETAQAVDPLAEEVNKLLNDWVYVGTYTFDEAQRLIERSVKRGMELAKPVPVDDADIVSAMFSAFPLTPQRVVKILRNAGFIIVAAPVQP